MPELIITMPDGRRMRHPLSSVPQVLGRDASCEIWIDDRSVSRRHARFAPGPRGHAVEDLGSKNGTLVNGAPCMTRVLSDGDEILVGGVRVRFAQAAGFHEGTVIVADSPTASRATRYIRPDQQLMLPQRRLQMLYELSDRLVALQSRDRLLEDALDICFEMLHFERGAVGVRPAHGRAVDWPVVRSLRDAAGGLTISRTVLSRALDHGERALYTSAGDAARSDPTVSMVEQGICSAMCVPLMHHDEVLGVIYGDRVSTSAPYSGEDVDFLAGIARQVSIGLVNARLMEDQKRMARLSYDVQLARNIQTGLFPPRLPDRAGLTVAAVNDPGASVSGDYYDVVETPGGQVWLLVADVTGEGVAAALLMANLQAVVRATIDSTDDPAELLGQWNRHIAANTGGSKFITCLLALVDPARGRIRLASAGHPAPIIVRSGGAAPLLIPEACFPLGIAADAVYIASPIDDITEPFLFFAYTDGLTEAMNEQGQRFGEARAVELVGGLGTLDAVAACAAARDAVAAFTGGAPPQDDMTLLAARVGLQA